MDHVTVDLTREWTEYRDQVKLAREAAEWGAGWLSTTPRPPDALPPLRRPRRRRRASR